LGKRGKEKNDLQDMEAVFMKMVGADGEAEPAASSTFLEEDSAFTPQVRQAPETSPGFPADLRLEVAPDAMLVTLEGRNAKSFEAGVVVQELKRLGVTQGLDLDVLYRTVSLFKEAPVWNGRIVLARGEPPKNREEIVYPFIERQDSPGEVDWLVEGENLPFGALLEIYDEEYLPKKEEIEGLRVKALGQGDVIATVKINEMPAPGFNVYGDVIAMTEPPLRPGKYIKKNELNGHYEAMIYGFLVISADVVSIKPAIKIAPNHMEAYFLNPPQVGERKIPLETDLKYGLILKGVKDQCVNKKKIKALCEAMKAGKALPPLVRIAKGLDPVNGEDAKFVHKLDLGKRAGAIREDESIDLKERNIVRGVEKGALLGEKILKVPGSAGVTIFGKKIRYVDGTDINILAKGPIKVIKKADRYLYYAKTNGNVSFRNNILTLTDTFRVDGNVDYATGNIDVTTGLVVTESVLAGFKVKAGGNTLIGGTVENGGSVFVDGDLEVGKGIIGEKTKVFVMGSLQAEFIQDAEVMVKGDIIISSYVFNGMVRAGGSIIVKKSASRRGGAVVGGVLCATKGVELSTIGSSANTVTTVAIQRDFELVGRLNKVLAEIQNCTATIAKMMRTVQIDDLNAETIKRLLASCPASKQEMIIKLLEHLNRFIKHRKGLYAKEEGIRKRIDIRLKKAKIHVKEKVNAGNKIQIGDIKRQIHDDTGRGSFQLDNDKIVYKKA